MVGSLGIKEGFLLDTENEEMLGARKFKGRHTFAW